LQKYVGYHGFPKICAFEFDLCRYVESPHGDPFTILRVFARWGGAS
jgi:hypothetical protein